MSENVYQKISRVQAALASTGIGKNRRNQAQNYEFRGIDDVYDGLSPVLSDVGLCMLPTIEDRQVTERASRNGGVMISTVVKVRYTLVSADDGSSHEIVVYGEGADTSDKSTAKATTAAYKSAAIQAFCIPVEGQVDADSETPELTSVISANQVKKLQDALSLAGLAEAELCKRVRIDALDQLAADRFDGAIDYLKKMAADAA